MGAATVPSAALAQLTLTPAEQTLVAPGQGTLTVTLAQPPTSLTIVDVTVSDRAAVLVDQFWFYAGETTHTGRVLTLRGGDPVTVTAHLGAAEATAVVHVLYPPPVITQVFPPTLQIGIFQPYLQVFDASFGGGPRTIFQTSIVLWNGVPLETQIAYGDVGLPTFLLATIRPTDVLRPGTATITVFNPGPGGGTSASITVEIEGAAVTVPTVSAAAAALLALGLAAAGLVALRRF